VKRTDVATCALSIGVLAFAARGTGCSSDSELPRSEQTVDGMTVDLAVIPAELVRGHSREPGDPNALHGGTPKNLGSHHIVVALFDAKSGTRITDAKIRARVGNRSFNHEPDTWLEPMQINGTVTYGNFFQMQTPGLWRIHLQIYRSGVSKPSEANFAYEHPDDTKQ
jgi:hypothetical protein